MQNDPTDSQIPDAAWEPVEPVDAQLEAFWIRARNVAKFNPLEVIVGMDDTSSLRPAAFCFGSNKDMADKLCQLVIDGTKRATSGWLATYEALGEPVPEIGELAIVCDGSGSPRALIRDTEVKILGFHGIGPDVAEAEGEGTFEQWKLDHEQFFRAECAAEGLEFDPEGEVVVEFFEVLYSY